MKVRIKTIPHAASDEVFGWWYYHEEGNEFELIKTEGPPHKSEIYYLVKDGAEKKHVKVEHAEIVRD
jgi:hypothetical protein